MRLILGLLAGALLAGCVTDQAKKDEEEAAKTTYVCLLEGERLVIRFDMGMARMLMPSGDRVDLYQIPGGSGVRFSNGNMELRGKGIELVLIDEAAGTQSVLTQCAPYSAPVPAPKR
jgi:membrane-bound inhibitor of C-type lysozyme